MDADVDMAMDVDIKVSCPPGCFHSLQHIGSAIQSPQRKKHSVLWFLYSFMP